MKFFIAFIALFAVAQASTIILPATHLVRSPADDSAIVQSQRIGGSFAYSTLEGHAYKAITPVVTQYELRAAAPLPLVYHAATPQIVYQQPLYTTSYVVPAGPAIVGAIPEAPKLEGRSDEPKPEEKKDDEDSVVVESA
uniref:CSON011952 protein n=1 Tax=Culicoides sonorensis TaxID=179676 RepID=A0A336LJM3_CULSO